jgi:hypothetical protein
MHPLCAGAIRNNRARDDWFPADPATSNECGLVQQVLPWRPTEQMFLTNELIEAKRRIRASGSQEGFWHCRSGLHRAER